MDVSHGGEEGEGLEPARKLFAFLEHRRGFNTTTTCKSPVGPEQFIGIVEIFLALQVSSGLESFFNCCESMNDIST